MEEILERLKKKFDRVFIFGSRTKGKQTGDIDIIVIDRGFEGKDRLERVELVLNEVWDLLGETGVDLDIIALTPEEFEEKKKNTINIVGFLASRGELVEA